MPSVTFVIPARDESAYIGCALHHLASARSSPELDFDVVVVEADGTVVLDHSADWILVLHDPAPGWSIARARNLGAQRATGELIFHTDADVLVPHLERVIPALQMSFSDPRVVGATLRLLPYPWDRTRLDSVMHYFLFDALFRIARRFGIHLSKGECQVVRRAAFEAIGGYDERIVAGEDCDLFQRLSQAGRILFLREMCVYHSPRRFRTWGYRKLLFMYVREAFFLTLFRRSYVSEWEPVR